AIHPIRHDAQRDTIARKLKPDTQFRRFVDDVNLPCLDYFFFIDAATTEIYTLSLHALFRSLLATAVIIPMDCKKRGWISPTVARDRKSTRLNSSHVAISYAVLCLKKKRRRSMNRAESTMILSASG